MWFGRLISPVAGFEAVSHPAQSVFGGISLLVSGWRAALAGRQGRPVHAGFPLAPCRKYLGSRAVSHSCPVGGLPWPRRPAGRAASTRRALGGGRRLARPRPFSQHFHQFPGVAVATRQGWRGLGEHGFHTGPGPAEQVAGRAGRARLVAGGPQAAQIRHQQTPGARVIAPNLPVGLWAGGAFARPPAFSAGVCDGV